MTNNRPPPPPPDRVDELARQISFLTTQFEALSKWLMEPSSSLASGRSSSESSNRPRLKLDVPRFDGTDTHGWIFKISQFFTYH